MSEKSGQTQDIIVEIPTTPRSASEFDQVSKKLYRAALNGNWDTAKPIFEKHPKYKSAKISQRGDTFLHIAAAADQTHFAKQLVNEMGKKELALQNEQNNTAFFLVATSGNVELAEAMIKKNSDLVTIKGSKDLLPLHIAALFGRGEMVLYLSQVTPDLKKDDAIKVLSALLNIHLYDVALQLLDDHPYLTAEAKEKPALDLLAGKPKMDSCVANDSEQGIWKKVFKIFSGKNVVRNKTSVDQELTLERLWRQIKMLNNVEIQEKFENIIFVAAKQGNVKLLTMLIHLHPDLIWKYDDKKRTIFHIAVLHRQESIFKLIHEIGLIKNLIASYKEKESGNNMLHMAGLLAPFDRLNIMPGAALQLQREILWFKEVKKIMQPLKTEAKNEKGETPEELFTEKHRDLMKEGEKWMKGTATSCMLVATLIATVVFTAAFTVPGGNNGTGIPIFLESIPFKIFAVSDAISLLFSCTSILMFLSILTSRYTKEDFCLLLPTKLIIGLVTLLISVAAMMVAFSSTFFIVFNHGQHKFAIAVAAIAIVPVILFVWLYWRLFIVIFLSTYKTKSMFHQNKCTLFPIEN